MIQVLIEATPVELKGNVQLPGPKRGARPVLFGPCAPLRDPPALTVAASQRVQLGAVQAAQRLAPECPFDRLVGGDELAEPPVHLGQRSVGFQVAGMGSADSFPGSSRTDIVADVRQGPGHHPQGCFLEPKPHHFVRNQAQIARAPVLAGPPDVFGEVTRKIEQGGMRTGGEPWQQLEHRAVDTFGRQRLAQSLHQLRDRGGGGERIIGQIAVGSQVEGDLVDPGTDQHGGAVTHGVPDAQFVEDVGVVHRYVRHDHVGQHELTEHVLADIAGLEDVARGAAVNPHLLQRRRDQFRVYPLEIDACLLPESADHECPHRSPPSALADAPGDPGCRERYPHQIMRHPPR